MSTSSIVRMLGTLALLGTTAIGVARAEDAHVNEMIFNVQSVYKSQINVISESGTKWDKIIPSDTMFWAHMKVDTRGRGYVEQVGIFVGHCTNTGCAGFPLVFADTVLEEDYNYQSNFKVPASAILVSNTGVGITAVGDEILRTCNQHLQPDGPTKPHTFPTLIPLSFSANTRKGIVTEPPEVGEGFGGGDHTRQGAFITTVNCLPKPSPQTDRGPQREQREVKSIDLFLSTYVTPASQHAGPSGSQCKPLRVTTRIATDKAGPVNVKLWRQVNGGAITSEVRAMNAVELGSGTFGADWNKWEHFTSTTHAQYKAEVLGGTFAPSTPWKDITIHCNGDLTVGSRPQNAKPDPVKPPRPGLVVDPRPNPKRPQVATPPMISCAGGVVVSGDCVCRPNARKVHAGKNAFRCMPNATADLRRPTASALPQRNASAIGPLWRGPGLAGKRFVR